MVDPLVFFGVSGKSENLSYIIYYVCWATVWLFIPVCFLLITLPALSWFRAKFIVGKYNAPRTTLLPSFSWANIRLIILIDVWSVIWLIVLSFTDFRIAMLHSLLCLGAVPWHRFKKRIVPAEHLELSHWNYLMIHFHFMGSVGHNGNVIGPNGNPFFVLNGIRNWMSSVSHLGP